MRRLFGVAVVIAAMMTLRRLAGAAPREAPGAALALGFALVVALVFGDLLRRFRLPRLSGYLLFGVLIGPYLGNFITEQMAAQLQATTGVATTLIAFIAGLTLNLERLGRRVPGAGRMTVVTFAMALAGLFFAFWMAWPWLPIAPDSRGLGRVAILALTAVVVVSFSPTMTAAVIAETGSRGRLSDLVLAIVVLSDLLVLGAYSLFMQLGRFTLGDPAGRHISVLARLAWEIGGAVAFGTLVGALFGFYLRYVAREVTLVLLIVCGVLSQVGAAQEFEPLLAAMAAGMVVANVTVAHGEALKAAIQAGALPVLVVFFVAVGTSLQLDLLASAGPAAIGLCAVRMGIIRLAVALGLKASGIERIPAGYIWTGLISQAGITLGLASALAVEFPGWGARVQTLLVAVIAIDELVGPALFRMGLTRAGEIDARSQRSLVVVSNREPYLHTFDAAGRITCTAATGGVAVALDALMRERRGVWIAHGAGTADRELVDAADKLVVPPDAPAYQLRRLWIDPDEFAGYYNGFANEGLWPLCHLVDVRPTFRREDWIAYQAVNERFARAIDEELPTPETPVFIQDYHLAVVAPRLRARRPLVPTALFWHIPWPYPDRLRICPWRRELLTGLLANDLVAFQLERDRRNFFLAVEEELGAEVEADGATVRCDGKPTTVIAVPIGVDYDRIQSAAADGTLAAEQRRLTEWFGLRARFLGLGVDRLDYTKGIPERLKALDLVLTRRPELRGQLTFLQIGVPSRSDLASYSAIESEIDQLVSDLNARHAQPGSPPAVVYHKGALALPSLVALYRLAHFCIVSSLHDGMNLVAKEFVAARDDEDGVLVLSAMAGAANELREALIINPYEVGAFADAIVQGLDMPGEERRRRMRAMRRVVAGRDVFLWATDILEGLENIWSKPLAYAARGPEDAPV